MSELQIQAKLGLLTKLPAPVAGDGRMSANTRHLPQEGWMESSGSSCGACNTCIHARQVANGSGYNSLICKAAGYCSTSVIRKFGLSECSSWRQRDTEIVPDLSAEEEKTLADVTRGKPIATEKSDVSSADPKMRALKFFDDGRSCGAGGGVTVASPIAMM